MHVSSFWQMTKVLLCSLAVASAFSVKKTDQPLLRLRGGLGGVEPTQVATAAACLSVANGLYCGLAPEPALEAYGMQKASFEVGQMCKSLGITNIAQAVLALSLLKGGDLNAAIGWSQLPFLLLSLQSIWDGTGDKMGQPKPAQFLLLGITAATMYCAFTGNNMPLAAQLSAGWALLNGIGAALAPGKLAAAWGMNGDASFEGMMKNFGYQLCSLGVLQYLVATGTDVSKAVGYAFALSLVGLVDMMYVSRSADAMGVEKNAARAWMVIQSAVAAFTLA